jgi:hypothetical protein
MTPIEIPVAILPVRLLVGTVTLGIATFIFWWSAPKFWKFLRFFAGREPHKPPTKPVHFILQLLLGLVVFAVVIMPATVATLIFLNLVTQSPTVITAEGISSGESIIHSRKFIRWEEVEEVHCSIARYNGSIGELRLVAGDRRIQLGNLSGVDLRDIRSVIQEHVREESMESCQ